MDVPVRIWRSFDSEEDCYVETADLSRPIVVAEIAPDYCDFIPDFPENDWYARGYVCIDGQHRIEKATRLEIESLPAVVLRMEQHNPFLYKGYDRYTDYWNGKLKDRTEDALRWRRALRKSPLVLTLTVQPTTKSRYHRQRKLWFVISASFLVQTFCV